MSQDITEGLISLETATTNVTIDTRINVELKAFNRLVYQPVSSMHSSWWKTLDLGVWQYKYQANSTLGQQIEALVVQCYGLSEQALPTQLTSQQRKMLAIRFKLEEILTVLGLFYLNVPEYLSLREYRDVLACVLTPVQIQQAWAMWPQRPARDLALQQCTISPDKLVERALGIGISLVVQQCQDDPIWLALALTLPSQRLVLTEMLTYQVVDEVDISRWLFRLERLL